MFESDEMQLIDNPQYIAKYRYDNMNSPSLTNKTKRKRTKNVAF